MSLPEALILSLRLYALISLPSGSETQTVDGAMLAITDSSGNSPLARLGMQPGDVVLSVNGHSLDALRSDEKLIEEVRDADTARLEIKRAGRKFFLTVPIP